MAENPASFAGNPLLMLPTLEVDGKTLIESDVICDYIFSHYVSGAEGGIPELQSGPEKYSNYNALSIMNGVMEAGVHRLRARRSGIEKLDDFAFFRQENLAIASGLAWLDKTIKSKPSGRFSKDFSYLDLTLACTLDWLVFREFLKDLEDYPNLKAFVKYSESIPELRATHPAITA